MSRGGASGLAQFCRSYRFTALLVAVGAVAYALAGAITGSWASFNTRFYLTMGVLLAVIHVGWLNASRFDAWERRQLERSTRRLQDRQGERRFAKLGCTFCGGPYEWLYPMTRDIELADSDWLLPASLPTCDSCHQDIEVDRHDALVARVAEANPGRKGRRAREVLVPVFLAARDGRPVQRSA